MQKVVRTVFALIVFPLYVEGPLWAHRPEFEDLHMIQVSSRVWDVNPLPPFFPTYTSLWTAAGKEITEDLMEAHEAFKEGLSTMRFHEAIVKFRRTLQEADSPPWAAEALWHIAEGYHRMLHFHEASEYWRAVMRALDKGAMMDMARVLLGESLFNMQRLREALDVFQETWHAFENPGIKGWVLFRMGDCSLGLGQEAQAKGFYEKALALNPHPRWIPPETLENMARDFLTRERGREAAYTLMASISLYGDHPRVHLWAVLLGRALNAQGKKKEAALLLEKTARLANGSRDGIVAKLQLATLGPRCSGLPGSPDEVTQMELEDPSSPFFTLDPKDKDLQWAMAHLAQCISQREGPLKGWEILGNLRRGLSQEAMWPHFKRRVWQIGKELVDESARKGEFSTAIEAFGELSEIFPGTWQDAVVLLHVARAKEELGFQDAATELYSRARNLAGSESHMREAALGLVRCYLTGLKTDEIKTLLRQEQSLGRDWRDIVETLLKWAIRGNARGTAEISAQLIKEKVNGGVKADTVVGLCRESIEKGICLEGVSVVERALISSEENPTWMSPRSWTALGDLYLCAGKTREARSWYLKAANAVPWEDASKWAVLKLLQGSMDEAVDGQLNSYLQRLLDEPQGSPWRIMAESLKERARPQVKTQGKGGKSS